MRERRFLVTEPTHEPLIEIHGAEAHHLLHVLRLRPGDEIVLFDGRGRHFRAVITRCESSFAVVEKLGPLPPVESVLDIQLGVAIPKGDRMSLIVRMLTELGVNRLIPLVTERTLVKSPQAARDKTKRWNRVAVEACKQSARSRIPEVAEPVSFEDLLHTTLPPARILVCPAETSLPQRARPASCLVLIGPEGGWTEHEVDKAIHHGFRKLGLGPRTLRVETAAAAAASILQWEWGDFRGREE